MNIVNLCDNILAKVADIFLKFGMFAELNKKLKEENEKLKEENEILLDVIHRFTSFGLEAKQGDTVRLDMLLDTYPAAFSSWPPFISFIFYINT